MRHQLTVLKRSVKRPRIEDSDRVDRILHVNVRSHPTAEWTAQQLVEALGDDNAPEPT